MNGDPNAPLPPTLIAAVQQEVAPLPRASRALLDGAAAACAFHIVELAGPAAAEQERWGWLIDALPTRILHGRALTAAGRAADAEAVEHHLSRVYAALGVRSRGELAAIWD